MGVLPEPHVAVRQLRSGPRFLQNVRTDVAPGPGSQCAPGEDLTDPVLGPGSCFIDFILAGNLRGWPWTLRSAAEEARPEDTQREGGPSPPPLRGPPAPPESLVLLGVKS